MGLGSGVLRLGSCMSYFGRALALAALTLAHALCFYSCFQSHSLWHCTVLTDTLMTEPGLPLCRNSSRAETTIEEFRCAKSRQERG